MLRNTWLFSGWNQALRPTLNCIATQTTAQLEFLQKQSCRDWAAVICESQRSSLTRGQKTMSWTSGGQNSDSGPVPAFVNTQVGKVPGAELNTFQEAEREHSFTPCDCCLLERKKKQLGKENRRYPLKRTNLFSSSNCGWPWKQEKQTENTELNRAQALYKNHFLLI